MRIAVYGSKRQESSAEQIRLFLENLRRRGATAVMHRKLYNHLYGFMPRALAAVGSVVDGNDFEADLAVSLGGDGTFLRTAMWVGDKEIPIIGVNTGHLGFLTALPVDRLPQLLDELGGDAFRMESRGVLELCSPFIDPHSAPYALNEIAIAKVETSSMIKADVSIDGKPLAQYSADGLIVCTATGSTAYNLSVGGPIVQPTVDVCVLSPVAAHSLTMRPMVVDGRSAIRIVPSGRASHVRLSLDSRYYEIETGTPVEIRRAPFTVRVLQPADRSFADILRDKLHWGEA